MTTSIREVAEITRYLFQTPHVLVDAIDASLDVKALAQVWSETGELKMAVASTARALNLIVNGRPHVSKLKKDLAGWDCFHYLHSKNVIGRADMRIVFRRKEDDVEVLGFGHRYLPIDFYDRITSDRARKHS